MKIPTYTQASLIAALTWIVGQAVAWVPGFAPYTQVTIAAGSSLITAAYLIFHAIHNHPATPRFVLPPMKGTGTTIAPELEPAEAAAPPATFPPAA